MGRTSMLRPHHLLAARYVVIIALVLAAAVDVATALGQEPPPGKNASPADKDEKKDQPPSRRRPKRRGKAGDDEANGKAPSGDPALDRLPDSDRVAAARRLLAEWDKPQPQLSFRSLWQVKVAVGAIAQADWSRDGSRVVVLTEKGQTMVFDSAGKAVARLKTSPAEVPGGAECVGAARCVAISPLGEYVAIGCEDGVAVWEVGAKTIAFVHNRPQGFVNSVRISGDGRLLVAADGSGNVCVYPLLGGRGGSLPVNNTPGAGARWAVIDPQGERIVFKPSGLVPTFEAPASEEGRVIEPANPVVADHAAIGNTLRVYGVTSFLRGRPQLLLQRREATEEKKGHDEVSFWLPFTGASFAAVATDEQSGAVVGRDGAIAIARVDVAHSLAFGRLADHRILAISPDLNKVLATSRAGDNLSAHAIDIPADPVAASEKWARDALERGDWVELEAALAAAAADRTAMACEPTLSRFEFVGRAIAAEPLDAEIAASKSKSAESWERMRYGHCWRLLQASEKGIVDAWQTRGRGFAVEVGKEAGQKFETTIESVREGLAPLFEDEDRPPPPELYEPWFQVAKAQVWPSVVVNAHVAKLLEQTGRWTPALSTVMESRMPRWGGDPDDCRLFAERVERALKGDAGKIAYARLAMRLIPYHGKSVFQSTDKEGLGLDLEKARVGATLALEQDPFDEMLDFECSGLCKYDEDPKLHELWNRRRLAP